MQVKLRKLSEHSLSCTQPSCVLCRIWRHLQSRSALRCNPSAATPALQPSAATPALQPQRCNPSAATPVPQPSAATLAARSARLGSCAAALRRHP